jgi:protein subunit release factor A
MKFQLDNILAEYAALDVELADPSIYTDISRMKSVNQKKKSLQKTVELYTEYKNVYANYDEVK